jgi:L-ascorbate metabolism protein UlaG (beta-lactamase superfamily)
VAAGQVVDQLAPRLVIPMHYRTARMAAAEWPIASLEESGFLAGRQVRSVPVSSVELDRAGLPPQQQVLVLTPP